MNNTVIEKRHVAFSSGRINVAWCVLVRGRRVLFVSSTEWSLVVKSGLRWLIEPIAIFIILVLQGMFCMTLVHILLNWLEAKWIICLQMISIPSASWLFLLQWSVIWKELLVLISIDVFKLHLLLRFWHYISVVKGLWRHLVWRWKISGRVFFSFYFIPCRFLWLSDISLVHYIVIDELCSWISRSFLM